MSSIISIARLVFFFGLFFLCGTSVSASVGSSDENESPMDSSAQRHLAQSDSSAWYARLIGTLISGASKASSTAHLPPTVPPPTSTDASLSINAQTYQATTSPPSNGGFLSSTVYPGNWFSARTHTPSPSSHSTTRNSSTSSSRGISTWMSSISTFFSGYKTQKSDTSPDVQEGGIDVPQYTPIYGPRDQYSPNVPYFNVLLPEHQKATPCIALSMTPDKKNMYVGNAKRPWDAQALALKRCYHDGQKVCQLDGIGVVSMGACIAVAKSDTGVLFSASSPMQEDEGLSTKQAALSKCAMTSQQVCQLEYFDCPF